MPSPAVLTPLAVDLTLAPDAASATLQAAFTRAEDAHVRSRLQGIPPTLHDVAEQAIRREITQARAQAAEQVAAARQQWQRLADAVAATTPKVETAEAALAKARQKAADLVRAPAAAWQEAVATRNAATHALERFLEVETRTLVPDDELRIVRAVLDDTLEAARRRAVGADADAQAWRATVPVLIAAAQACNTLGALVLREQTTPLAWAAAQLAQAAEVYAQAREAARVAETTAALALSEQARALVGAAR